MSASRRPVIGVTMYPRQGGDVPTFSLPTSYVDALRRAGGIPLLLAPGDERPDELLEHVDALVLAGGGDIDPVHFESDPHPTLYGVCDERDRFELELTRAAVERAVPVLGVCRGLQVLNVALGGDLHLHLPETFGEEVLHRHPERRPIEHPVELDPASRLAAIYGETHLLITSWHHQGVNRLGRGLEPTAWAPDGTVEAVELRDERWVVAVQWHPEIQSQQDGSPQRRLFAALVARARNGSG